VVPVSLQRLPQAVRALTLRPCGEKTCASACIYDPAEETVLAAESTVRVLLDPPQTGGIIPVMVADTDYPDGFSVTVETVSGETVEIPELASFEELVNTPYTLGTSLAINSSQTLAQLKRIKDAGIEWVEVTCNSFQRKIPEAEWETRAENIRKIIADLGLKVWSCHLPFSGTLDISVLDDAQRAKNVELQKRMIRLCGEKYHPKRLVLHPSSEPIAEGDRAKRLENARASIGELLPVAREIGAVLCIENLPRTCLGRVTSEMKYLIEPYPEVMVCFDVNHLLIETHAKYFADLGERIGNVHISDYDRIDERHALPGDGVIDWPALHYMLRLSGYDGIFMHEVKSGKGTPAQIVERYNNVIFVDHEN
jgi:sugar phosphate isomerase/epimerase